MVIGLWAGRLPLSQPYGEASYYLEATRALVRLLGIDDVRWLLSGREAAGDLGALGTAGVPVSQPRLPWPPRRITRALRIPRLEWQYKGVQLVHFWTTKGAAATHLPSVVTILDGIALSGQYGESGDVEEAKRLAQGARVVMTLTPESAGLIRDALDIRDIAIIPVGAGVDTTRFTPVRAADDEAVLTRHGLVAGYLLYVGGWAPRKGLATLAAALTKLTARERPVVALTGRPQPQDAALAGRFAAQGTKLLGYVHKDDMPALLRNASALVMPSLAEGFGLPIIEAQACGTAVVASDLPVIRAVSGGHCDLVPAGDAAMLASALTEIPHRRNDYLEPGLANAERHSWQAVAERIRAVYSQALGLPRQGASVVSTREHQPHRRKVWRS